MANSIAPDNYISAAYASKTGSAKTDQMKPGSGKSSNDVLGFQDFLQLIVAQMKNQDMMNPMNDTEFIGQMAQMAVMQSVNNMTQVSLTHYATSLLGKEITAAVMDPDKGLQTTEGIVTGVSLFEGQPVFYLGDKGFTMGNIMAVGKLPKKEEGDGDADKPNPDGDGDGGKPNPDETPPDVKPPDTTTPPDVKPPETTTPPPDTTTPPETTKPEADK